MTWGKHSRLLIVCCAALTLLALLASLSGDSAARRKTKSRWRPVAEGIEYRLYRFARPNKIRVVSFDPSAAATADVVLATDKLEGYERTSSMAARTDGVVAINGDYSRPNGAPVFTFAQDGRLEQDPERDTVTGAYKFGRNFSMTTDETNSYFGNPKTRAWFFEEGSPESEPISRFNNGEPGTEGISAFSPTGGKDQKPPGDSCYVRLRQMGPPQTTSTPHAPLNNKGIMVVDFGVEQPFFVGKARCRPKRVNPKGGVTLVADPLGTRAATLQGMTRGEEVTLGWSLNWADVFDTIGGNPTLIEDGRIQSQSVDDGSAFASTRAPRTGVGYNANNGRIFFVTVDGRQPKYSVGMNLREFANFFKRRLHATDALNLDGGGSTTMVVKGSIKGRPSDDAGERAVSSALVLLPGPDPGEDFSGVTYPTPPEPSPTPTETSPTPTPTPTESPTPPSPLPRAVPQAVPSLETYSLMVEDPASIGGLSAYFDRRAPWRDLPFFMRRAAREFRGRSGFGGGRED
ncbi:MAG: phosphodiester glycosidase family protein [Actinomycetota bacterium]